MRVPIFDESLRTGQPLIDEQHEWLFKLAARVAEIMGSCELGTATAAVPEQFGGACSLQVKDGATEAVYGLLDYATEHFSDEEALQREAHYPLASFHASLHADLSRRLAPFVVGQVNDEEIAADRVTEFFVEWLSSHIMEHDRRFTEWLAAHSPFEGVA